VKHSAADPAGAVSALSWRELVARVHAAARAIGEVARPGDRVAILAGQDLSYVIGFLAAMRAGTIAVPLYAPEVATHSDRLVGALADCAPSVWLTSARAEQNVREFAARHAVAPPEHLMAIDRTRPLPGIHAELPQLRSEDVAYLQYTSGATRRPAGTVVTHRALAANLAQLARAFDFGHASTTVGWIPFFHDMGLLQLLCLPLATGAHSVFTTPMSFLRRPSRWLRQLAGYPDVLSAAPNFAFNHVLAKTSPADLAGLDLSGVRAIVNGSEPVEAETLAAFGSLLAPAGLAAHALRPSYGLAEATLFVASGPARKPPAVTRFNRSWLSAGRAVEEPDPVRAVTLVSVGSAVGQDLVIAGPGTGRRLPAGEVGEIWLRGPNMMSTEVPEPSRHSDSLPQPERAAVICPRGTVVPQPLCAHRSRTS
jgi:fatty acid CoA ligase FadD32